MPVVDIDQFHLGILSTCLPYLASVLKWVAIDHCRLYHVLYYIMFSIELLVTIAGFTCAVLYYVLYWVAGDHCRLYLCWIISCSLLSCRWPLQALPALYYIMFSIELLTIAGFTCAVLYHVLYWVAGDHRMLYLRCIISCSLLSCWWPLQASPVLYYIIFL